MKMEHNIISQRSGKIKTIYCKEGEFIESGAVLLEFEDN